jgi:hypothetical protein
VHFGTGAEYNVDIGPRRDKNNTIQISVDASYGAGRANEKKSSPSILLFKPLVCLPGTPRPFFI